MSAIQRIEAIIGVDYRDDLSKGDCSNPDYCRMLQGTLYNELWHAAYAGHCTHEEAEQLTADLCRELGAVALLQAS